LCLASVDRLDFEDEFRLTAAMSVLRRFVAACESTSNSVVLFRRSVVSSCLRACSLLVNDLDGYHHSIDNRNAHLDLTEEEWHTVLAHSYDLHAASSAMLSLGSVSPRRHDVERSSPQSSLYRHALRLISRLKARLPQWDLTGVCNVWIVKPGAASRGTGIVLHSKLDDILSACHHGHVVQKYVENPLLLSESGRLLNPASLVADPCARKFDVRQLVLVTSWRPLTVYMYDTFYLRLASAGFDLSPSGIGNRFSHLCNFSVQKSATKDTATVDFDESETTLTAESLRLKMCQLLGEDVGESVFRDRVLHGIRHSVIAMLQSAQPHVHHRTNSFELYGADFVIDSQWTPWLLELNLSPALNKRTPYMSKMLTQMAEGLVDIVLRHYREPAPVKSKVPSPVAVVTEEAPSSSPPA
jgi:Tubulin-tyrosine ligase family